MEDGNRKEPWEKNECYMKRLYTLKKDIIQDGGEINE